MSIRDDTQSYCSPNSSRFAVSCSFFSRRYKHNWRYHKELRLWLTKEAGTEPTQKTASYERGSYMCVMTSTSTLPIRRVRISLTLVLAQRF